MVARTTYVSGMVKDVGSNVKVIKKGDVIFAPAAFGVKVKQELEIDFQVAVTKPKTFTASQAAVFPSLACLILQALWRCGISNTSILMGKRVIVTGGTSPVGSLAIQYFKALGCYVIATSDKSGKEEQRIGADEIVDYKSVSFYDELSDLFLVVDALGSSAEEEFALRRGGVLYASIMNPLVALVTREGVLKGGIEVYKFSRGEETPCQWVLSEEGANSLREFAYLLQEANVKPRFDKESYTAAEWLEAMSWPKDVDTGLRYGFPGPSLWKEEDGTSTLSQEMSESDRDEDQEVLQDEESMREMYDRLNKDDSNEISFEEFKRAQMGAVRQIESEEQIKGILMNSPPDMPVLVEFHAPFCMTCRKMMARFSKMSKKKRDAIFLSVNVKEHKSVASMYNVKDVPSFVLFRSGSLIAQYKGAISERELLKLIES
mmetsp:Transcript_49819/g.155921  ORF Transcript_49819/g.155921 Transcript_49819/m.155921 type:complete len:432 (+) Transcript_49819:424-1719(+)